MQEGGTPPPTPPSRHAPSMKKAKPASTQDMRKEKKTATYLEEERETGGDVEHCEHRIELEQRHEPEEMLINLCENNIPRNGSAEKHGRGYRTPGATPSAAYDGVGGGARVREGGDEVDVTCLMLRSMPKSLKIRQPKCACVR